MKIKIIAQLVYFIIRIINFTYRYEYIGLENKKFARDRHPLKTFVFAVWHQNLIGAILAHGDEKYTMIVSGSKDGELVAVTCQKLGHEPARGSSTRDGKKALIEIVKKIKSGIPGAITVDGPKGPPHVVKPGVIEIARLAGCAIVPMSTYPLHFWTLTKSWDQFRIPKPFTKIAVVIGKPIFCDENVTREQFEHLSLEVASHLQLCEVTGKKHFGLI